MKLNPMKAAKAARRAKASKKAFAAPKKKQISQKATAGGQSSSSGFSTTQKPAGRGAQLKYKAKKKTAPAVAPFKSGRRAGRRGATAEQIKGGTTSKRMRAGGTVGRAEIRAEKGVKGPVRTKNPGAFGATTKQTTVRLGAPKEKSSIAKRSKSSGTTRRDLKTVTVSRKAAGGTVAAGGGAAAGAGGYTTYKRKNKNGTVTTVKRKKKM